MYHKLLKKITNTLTVTAADAAATATLGPYVFGNLALGAAATNTYIAGDRGCLPTFNVIASAAYPTATAGWVVGTAGATLPVYAAASSDYQNIVTAVCHTHGVCCTSFNCNISNITNINFILLIFSVFLSKINF